MTKTKLLMCIYLKSNQNNNLNHLSFKNISIIDRRFASNKHS